MKTQIIVVRVKPNLKRRLFKLAERQEMTMAEVYRDAFETYCSARGVGFAPEGAAPTDYSQILPELAGPGGIGG